MVAWAPDAVPPLNLITLESERIDLAEARQGLVLVHFFATWCEPCRGELHQLDLLAQRFQGRALRILLVDVAEPPHRLRRYFSTNPVRFPVLLDTDRAATKAWGVEALPTTFVVSAGRCPLWRVNGEHDWSQPAGFASFESALRHAEARTRDPSSNPCQPPGDDR
ncbi:MAG: TlpA disulfide reductase family protein [Hyphomicrobiaceae bacterium]